MNYDSLYSKWEACERLSRDPGTTEHERANARRHAARLRALLDQIGLQTVDVSEANYRHYVNQGLQAQKYVNEYQWVLGKFASLVEIDYGRGQLKKYAADIHCHYDTLKDYRTTYNAWPTEEGRPAFWIARVLNSHPNRYAIIKQNPNLTYREAKDIMRKFRGPQPGARSQRRSQQQAPQPDETITVEPLEAEPPQLTIDQLRALYVAEIKRLPKAARGAEIVKFLNLTGVKME